MPSTSGSSDEIIRIALPSRGEPVHQLVDLDLARPTSMPRVGSSRISTSTSAASHLPEHDLLLVAAAQSRPTAARRLGRLDAQVVDLSFAPARPPPARRPRRAATAGRALGSATLRLHRAAPAPAPASCGPRAAGRCRAGSRPRGPRACRTSRPFRKTRPTSGRSAPTSARASSVRPAPSSPATPTISPRRSVRLTSRSDARARQALRPAAAPRPAARAAAGSAPPSSRPAISRTSSGTRDLADAAASPRGGRRAARSRGGRCARPPPCGARCRRRPTPARGQALDGREQLGDLGLAVRAEVGSSMIRMRASPGERLRDLDHLLLRDAQLAHGRARDRSRRPGGPSSARAPPVLQPRRSMTPQRPGSRPRKMFSATRELRDEVQLLVDDADAQRLRVARARDLDRLAVQEDLARVLAPGRRSGSS